MGNHPPRLFIASIDTQLLCKPTIIPTG